MRTYGRTDTHTSQKTLKTHSFWLEKTFLVSNCQFFKSDNFRSGEIIRLSRAAVVPKNISKVSKFIKKKNNKFCGHVSEIKKFWFSNLTMDRTCHCRKLVLLHSFINDYCGCTFLTFIVTIITKVLFIDFLKAVLKNHLTLVSFVHDFIIKYLPSESVKKIIFLSDSCMGQNKNHAMVLFSSWLSKRFNISVEHIYPV